MAAGGIQPWQIQIEQMRGAIEAMQHRIAQLENTVALLRRAAENTDASKPPPEPPLSIPP
jgi:hypothetical protein